MARIKVYLLSSRVEAGWRERKTTSKYNVFLHGGRHSVPGAPNSRACNLSILFDSSLHTLHSKYCKDRAHRIGLFFVVFLHTDETSFLNFQDARTYFLFPFFSAILSFFLAQCGVCICVCWGQGYENKSLPLSQVMCLFSRTHLLVYCVVAFLSSYRLALTGHFSPSNPVHHILVLESVKWVLEKRGHNVCLCCYWTQMGLVLFCPGRCINGSF